MMEYEKKKINSGKNWSVKCEEKKNNQFITHIQSPGKFSSKKLLVANVAEVIDIRL